MSFYDGKDHLYLIWKEPQTRRQFIVGTLEKNGQFEFQYGQEISLAVKQGFTPLICFPDFNKKYVSDKLFPIFSSRLPDKKRKDISKILNKYGMNEYDDYILLKRSGARLPIDSLEFVDPLFDNSRPFQRIFYMAGTRYYLGCEGEDCDKSLDLTRGDEVCLRWEKDNPYDTNAVQVYSISGKLLGYIPRYYSEGVKELLLTGKMECHIFNVDKNKNCNECVRLILKVK